MEAGVSAARYSRRPASERNVRGRRRFCARECYEPSRRVQVERKLLRLRSFAAAAVSIGSYRLHETLGGARRTLPWPLEPIRTSASRSSCFPTTGSRSYTEIARAAVPGRYGESSHLPGAGSRLRSGIGLRCCACSTGATSVTSSRQSGIQRSQTAGPGHIPIAIGMMAEFARATDAVSGGFADLMQPGFLLPEHLFVTWSGECMALDPRWVALSEWASSRKDSSSMHSRTPSRRTSCQKSATRKRWCAPSAS